MLVYNKLQCVFTVYFNCFVQRVCKHSFSCEKASQKKDVFSQPLSPAFLNLLICPLSPPLPSAHRPFLPSSSQKRVNFLREPQAWPVSLSYLSLCLFHASHPPILILQSRLQQNCRKGKGSQGEEGNKPKKKSQKSGNVLTDDVIVGFSQ